MKRGLQPKGFTIVETMIVLAVSSLLLISAISLVGGSQSKSEFSVSIKDFDQQLTKVINNVANGYYPGLNGKSCVDDGSDVLDLTQPSANQLGTNKSCVFLGRVIEFTNSDYFNVYSVAGLREKSNVVVTKMKDSKATAINTPEKILLKNGLRVEKIAIGTVNTYGSVGFFTSLGATESSSSSQLVSGALTLDFIGINDGTLATPNEIPNYLINSGAGSFRNTYDEPPTNTNKNPTSGLKICVKSGTSNKYGLITIGGEGQTATTRVEIKENCPL